MPDPKVSDRSSGPVLTKAHIDKQLFEVSSFFFATRVAIWLGMLFGGVLLTIIVGGPWGWTLGVLLTGLGIAHGVELSHQALHDTGFRERRWNEIVGVAMGLPMMVSFYEYKISHLMHHAKVGTPQDTEFFDYGEDETLLSILIDRIFMVRHFNSYLRNLGLVLQGDPLPNFKDRHQRKLRLFYMLSLSAVLVLVGLCLYFNTLAPLAFWLLALFAVASPVHAFIEFPEHFGCDRDNPNVLHNTRSIRSNALMRWFTNSNNFHVEHHYFPTLPLQNAVQVHGLFAPHIKHLSPSYRGLYMSLLRETFQRRKEAVA